MQSETFQFKAASTQDSMTGAVRVLSGIEGVGAVTPSLMRNEVTVQFNDDLTSRQHLEIMLTNAGYAIQPSGSTGGGCGGGGACTCR